MFSVDGTKVLSLSAASLHNNGQPPKTYLLDIGEVDCRAVDQ